jgi:hypothetical protein
VSTAAERIKEAADRDEAAAFTPPEGAEDVPETEPIETEEAEEAETETAEPAPEPEPAQPDTGLNAEQTQELERATIAYNKRVAKAFGGELPPECPACMGLGFDLTGGAGAPDYREASDKDVCDECDGFGGVRSGSKVPGQDIVRCERCKGAGYLVTRPVEIRNQEQVAPVVVQLAEGNADGGQATALKPGEPGWEPWMGNAPS